MNQGARWLRKEMDQYQIRDEEMKKSQLLSFLSKNHKKMMRLK